MLGIVLLLVLQPPLTNAFQKKLLFLEIKLPQDYSFKSITALKEYFFTRTTAKGEKVRLNALYYSPIGQKKGTVFYLHGTLGNLKTQDKHIHDFVERGYAVFIYDYRSYGKSMGEIHDEGDLHEDADFMFHKFLQLTDLRPKQVVIVGRSLGTGIAVPLAAKYTPHSLILISPYWQMSDVAKRFLPYLPRTIIDKNLKFDFRTDLMISQVHCPMYVFHGTLDELIPFRSGKKFASVVSENGEFIPIKGAGHLNITKFSLYQQKLDSILSN